jgi:hypothetical protein
LTHFISAPARLRNCHPGAGGIHATIKKDQAMSGINNLVKCLERIEILPYSDGKFLLNIPLETLQLPRKQGQNNDEALIELVNQLQNELGKLGIQHVNFHKTLGEAPTYCVNMNLSPDQFEQVMAKIQPALIEKQRFAQRVR